MAINAQPKVFNVIPGNSADTAEIQDAASSTDPSMSAIFPPIYQTPLSAGGKAPERTTFNTLFKEYGEHLYYLQRGGVYGYDATLDYGKGATVYYNGSIYTAIEENGPSTDAGAVAPDNATVWQKVMINSDISDTYATKASLIARLPAGVIIPFAGTSVPSGYLLCNGALVSRTDYADLFAAVGTLYGAGDGSTTFALPDLRDRVLQGSSSTHAAGSYIAAGLPDIFGHYGGSYISSAYTGANLPKAISGCFSADIHDGLGITTYANEDQQISGDMYLRAQRYNALYGASSTVQPLAAVAQYLIRY